MEIIKTGDSEGITLKVNGKLSAATAEEFDAALDGAVGETRDMVLDFAGLSYLASAGLRCLIAAHKRIKAKNGRLSIINVSDAVREIFEITALEDLFDLE
ncbi:MAG: STAS domain-containing protein [Treponema sp.]|jgi:anti-sigma B factor antagonist|nr:STAS domain-containing protein [Treponema sp.]